MIDNVLPVSQKNVYSYTCCTCQNTLLDPFQTRCGLRICGTCIKTHIDAHQDPAPCPCRENDCGEQISLTIKKFKVQPDFCLRKELKKKVVRCRYHKRDCQELIAYNQLKVHEAQCEYGKVECENSSLGCPLKVTLDEKQEHSDSCDYRPTTCNHCSMPDIANILMKDHIKLECPDAEISCPNGCEAPRMLRKDLNDHDNACPEKQRDCPFNNFGCSFKGTSAKLKEHQESEDYHVQLMADRIALLEDTINQNQGHKEKDLTHMRKLEETMKRTTERENRRLRETQKMVADQQQIIQGLKESVKTLEAKSSSLEDTRKSLESSLALSKEQLATTTQKLSQYELRFQVLETASYNGTLLWKICDYSSRKAAARQGGVISLYSQSFYTSRHGYRMCARVYLNGDGMGLGSHLSLFFVVMRGQYDALLAWPFRPKVSLMLLDQAGRSRHIVDTFKPDPSSTSFQRPTKEMNVASGCPLFVSHSILEAPDSLFLKDDTLFIKVLVDMEGIQVP